MSNTTKKTKSDLTLTVTSTSLPDFENEEKHATVLSTESKEFEVFVFTSKAIKSKHQDRMATLLRELWNNYHALPQQFKYHPRVLFNYAVMADKLVDSREKEIEQIHADLIAKQEEIKSLSWWNKVYRFGLLLVLLGLITYALI